MTIAGGLAYQGKIIDKRFEQIETRFEQIEKRIEQSEKNITARFDDLKQEVRAQRK